MRGATGITLQPHQILPLPRKTNLMIDPHHIWNVIYNARSNRHHPPTSPNTAPAAQNESHDWSASHMKRHLHCAEQKASPSNLTKYCACHAKWISWLLRITYETSFTMRRATGITLQPHQILPLLRKISTHYLTEICWKQVQRHFQCATDPRPFRPYPTQKTQTATRRAAKATFRTGLEQILLKITTFPAPAIMPNFTTCCACHEQWHMNFTKCCTCHKKWHMNVTKCCTCHKKWHMNFTKCCTCHKKWHMNFTKYCACHEKWHMNFTKCCAGHEKWHMNFTKCCTCHKTTTATATATATTTTTTATATATTTTTTTTGTTTGTTTTTTTMTTTTRTTTTTTTTTATATTTTARNTIPVRLPKSSYIGSLPLNFL